MPFGSSRGAKFNVRRAAVHKTMIGIPGVLSGNGQSQKPMANIVNELNPTSLMWYRNCSPVAVADVIDHKTRSGRLIAKTTILGEPEKRNRRSNRWFHPGTRWKSLQYECATTVNRKFLRKITRGRFDRSTNVLLLHYRQQYNYRNWHCFLLFFWFPMEKKDTSDSSIFFQFLPLL